MYFHQTGSSGSDTVISLSATSGKYWSLENLLYSYSGLISLGNGRLRIQFAGVTVLDFDVKNDLIGGAIGSPTGMYNSMQAGNNEAVEIRLFGNGSLVGKLNLIANQFDV